VHLAAVEEPCPEKMKLFQDISLSARTVTRRQEDLGTSLLGKLKEKAKSFLYYSLAMDAVKDVSDVDQLLIFIHGVDQRFSNYCCWGTVLTN
jgi:hypothetical protein